MWPISARQHVPLSAQKRSIPSKETQFNWVASGAASAALRTLPRYLPWGRREALHPSAPDATRVARLKQCFLKREHAYLWPCPPVAPAGMMIMQGRLKIPISVLVVIHTPQLEVLLLERADHPGFWQSVTGSQSEG